MPRKSVGFADGLKRMKEFEKGKVIKNVGN